MLSIVLHLQYNAYVALDWTHRGTYIRKHGVHPNWADEAYEDPNRLVVDPDPASLSGRTQRVIGWSTSAGRLLTVIVLPDEACIWGVNCWPSNLTDQRRYLKGEHYEY